MAFKCHHVLLGTWAIMWLSFSCITPWLATGSSVYYIPMGLVCDSIMARRPHDLLIMILTETTHQYYYYYYCRQSYNLFSQQIRMTHMHVKHTYTVSQKNCASVIF